MTDANATPDQIVVSTNIQTTYDEQYTDQIIEWRMIGGKYKAQHIVDLCKRQNLKINTLLEVGAGEGSILQHLYNWGFCDNMDALEISDSGIDFIKSRSIPSVKNVQKFDGYQIPYKDDSVDLIILSHVLEHVEYPRALLREVWRVAKYQVVEVPCDYSPTVDEKFDHFMAYGHINIYNPPIMRYLLKSEGFTIIEDLSTRTPPEVVEYIRFNSQARPKTFFALQKLRWYLRYRDWLFNRFGRQGREKRGEAYTVLCGKTNRPSIF